MTAQTWLTLVAVSISALSLGFAVYVFRRKTDDARTDRFERQTNEYIDQLEGRLNDANRQIEELKGTSILQGRDLDDCKRARDAFEDKNFQLLQEVYDLRKKVDGS